MKRTNMLKTSLLSAAAILVLPAFAYAQSDLLPPPFEARAEAPKTAQAQPSVEYLSEDELQRAYERAAREFGQSTAPVQPIDAPTQSAANENPGEVPAQVTQSGGNQTPGTVIPMNYPTSTTAPIAVTPSEVGTSTVPIGQVRLNVALENMPLEQVMNNVIQTVSQRSGQWNVRWRLSNENERVRTERVNINAETDFETFMAYLAERVNNMTGVQLFVKVFEGSRLIIIADNY